jgi:hypothetical protein
VIINDGFVPGLHQHALDLLAHVRSRPADATLGERVLLSLLALHDARACEPAAEVVPLVDRALGGGALLREDASGTAFVPAVAVLSMADLDEALVIYEDALAEAHRRGSALAFAAAKVFRLQTLVWRGDLSEAEAEAREVLVIGEAWGPTARFTGHGSAFFADALMEQGKLEEATAVLAGVSFSATRRDSERLLFLNNSGARLRILRGDLRGGVAELMDAGHRFESVGSRNPALIAWRSPAALALLQLGEQEKARCLATRSWSWRASGGPRARSALRSALPD